MTFSVQVLQENLRNALAVIAPAIPTRPTLAALTSIRLSVEDGYLTVSATDLDIAITTRAAAKVTEGGIIVVPGHELIQQIDAMPNAVVSISVDGKKCVVACEQAVTRMAMIDAEEWPQLPTLDDAMMMSVGSIEFRAALNRAMIAVAKDDSRPVLTGVLFELGERGHLELGSADGFQASIARVTPLATDLPLDSKLVPGASIKALLTAIRGAAADAAVTIHSSSGPKARRFIGFRFGSTEVISVLIDGEFPKYRQLFPAEFLTTVNAPRQAFARAVRLAALTDKILRLHVGEASIRVATENETNAHSNDIGFCEVSGPPIDISVDSGYVADMLPLFDGDNVSLKFIDQHKQILACDGAGKDYWQVVTMPMFQNGSVRR